MKPVFKLLYCLWLLSVPLRLIRSAEPLPNTKPLTEHGDLAAKMVAGIHKYLDRELAAAPAKRDAAWKIDLVIEGGEGRVRQIIARQARTSAEDTRRGR